MNCFWCKKKLELISQVVDSNNNYMYECPDYHTVCIFSSPTPDINSILSYKFYLFTDNDKRHLIIGIKDKYTTINKKVGRIYVQSMQFSYIKPILNKDNCLKFHFMEPYMEFGKLQEKLKLFETFA